MTNRHPFGLRELVGLHRQALLSADELRDRQWKRFQGALQFCFEHISFYRQKLDNAGLRPEDIRTRDDLALLPVTRREDLRDPTPFLRCAVDVDKLRSSKSSGTTGQKAISYFDCRAWLTGKYLLKARARFLCGVRPWDRVAKFQQGKPRNSWISSRLLRQRGYSLGPSCVETLRRVRPYQPTVLYGFPSYLVELASAATEPLRARLVFTSGETLGIDQRSVIEDWTGGRVLDVYGCTEVKEISWQCDRQAGYHINADWLLVEVVTPEGLPTAEAGRVLVSCLYNAAMPLIRYEVGDLGVMTNDRCDCGLPFPTMSPSLGRKHDSLLLLSGEAVSPMRVIDALKVIERVDRYQVVQGSDSAIVVRVVAKPPYRDAIRGRIQTALSPIVMSTPVTVEFRDRIDREPSGKYRRVISQARSERSDARG